MAAYDEIQRRGVERPGPIKDTITTEGLPVWIWLALIFIPLLLNPVGAGIYTFHYLRYKGSPQ